MRAILVDAGGVLFDNVTESSDFMADVARTHGVDPRAVLAHVERLDADYETNRRSVHAVLAEGLERAGSHTSYDAAAVDRLYMASVVAHPPVFAELRRLRRRDDVVLALANNEAERWDRLKDEAFGHLGLFDVVGSSWRLGYVKPSPEYFTRLLAACDCAPQEALLLDDNPAVVAGARAVGVPAVLVAGPVEAAAALAVTATDPTVPTNSRTTPHSFSPQLPREMSDAPTGRRSRRATVATHENDDQRRKP
jgi:putative hydrolase of the HAD superfamily